MITAHSSSGLSIVAVTATLLTLRLVSLHARVQAAAAAAIPAHRNRNRTFRRRTFDRAVTTVLVRHHAVVAVAAGMAVAVVAVVAVVTRPLDATRRGTVPGIRPGQAALFNAVDEAVLPRGVVVLAGHGCEVFLEVGGWY